MSTDTKDFNINNFHDKQQGYLDAIEHATRELNAAKNNLELFASGGGFVGSDGSTIILEEGSEALRDRVEELTEDLKAAEDAAAKKAEDTEVIAWKVIEAAESAAAVELPTNADWQRAANMRVVMESQLWSASVRVLVKELNGAALSGDPAKQYVVASIVAERLPKLDPVKDGGSLIELRPQLEKLADSMLAALKPESLKKDLEDAKALAIKAGVLERLVYQSRMERGERVGYALKAHRKGKYVKITA